MTDGDRALGDQFGGIVVRDRALGTPEHFFENIRLGHGEYFVGQAHPFRQFLGQAKIRPRLGLGFDNLVAILHIISAVGSVEILGFQIGRGG